MKALSRFFHQKNAVGKKSLHKVIDHENLCQCVDQNVFLIRLREKFFTLLMQNRNFMISIFSTDVCGKYDQFSLGKLAYQAEHVISKLISIFIAKIDFRHENSNKIFRFILHFLGFSKHVSMEIRAKNCFR